jgi:hypothetical protein
LRASAHTVSSVELLIDGSLSARGGGVELCQARQLSSVTDPLPSSLSDAFGEILHS